MKPIKTLIIAFAGIVVGVVITSLYQVGTSSLRATIDGQQLAPTPDTSEDFARAAVGQQQAGNADEAESLEQAALVHARNDPSQIPAIWAILQQQISRKQVGTDTVNRLLAFQATIDAALPNSRQLDDFDVAWNARNQVAQLLSQQRDELVATASQRLADLKKTIVSSKSFAEAANIIDQDRHPSVRDTAAISLDELLSSTSYSGSASTTRNTDVVREAVIDVANALTTKAEAERMDIDRVVMEKADEDTKGGNLDPRTPAPGPYQSDIERLTQLQEAVNAADLRHWAALAMDQTVADRIEKFQAGLQTSTEKAMRLQQTRYNLWALQQLHVAEDAPDWPEYMGQIDVRLALLRPSLNT